MNRYAILVYTRFALFLLTFPIVVTVHGSNLEMDLTNAVVVVPENITRVENKAIDMLLYEVEKRTMLRWKLQHAWPEDSVPVIVMARSEIIPAIAKPYSEYFESHKPLTLGEEGYRIVTLSTSNTPALLVAGHDERGVLFGCGRLLRELVMSRQHVGLEHPLDINTVPAYPLRGHQLGYRPKTNSYDGWTISMWEQYLRDLVVFGTNAVELIPPHSDDAATSPHFPLPQMDMMVRMSQLLDDYGLDVWVWYPAIDGDYSNPAVVESSLIAWSDVLSKLPRLDAVFVPGGDPGGTPPPILMELLKKQQENLRRFHPNVEMWVSTQGFHKQWMDEFLNFLQESHPTWLKGIVFGPQNFIGLPELRERVPKEYPIRRYPDITHSLRCQYAVQDWDAAYAFTENRESINPRPRTMARIFRLWDQLAIGFLSYSEGCNDDVNKMIWSALGWDPDTDVLDILRQYSRYFIGKTYEDSFAQGLLALEKNWEGPLLTNGNVYTTLQQFQTMEKTASPQLLLNWRFQQALYRAYYDAYTRKRLLYETQLEEKAMDTLRRANEFGSSIAIDEAEETLNLAVLERPALDWRSQVFELAEALYQSIRMQLSVPRYKAIHVERGANLDLIDTPLNNRPWLLLRPFNS